MNTHRRSADGFTLIELMLAMGLFSALAIALIALLSRATGLTPHGGVELLITATSLLGR